LASVAARKNPVHTVSSVIVPPQAAERGATFQGCAGPRLRYRSKRPLSKGAFPIDLVNGLVAQNAVALLYVVAI